MTSRNCAFTSRWIQQSHKKRYWDVQMIENHVHSIVQSHFHSQQLKFNVRHRVYSNLISYTRQTKFSYNFIYDNVDTGIKKMSIAGWCMEYPRRRAPVIGYVDVWKLFSFLMIKFNCSLRSCDMGSSQPSLIIQINRIIL